ncbi:MAG: histidine triad nucleotide-binding protein [Pseudomonadota bacterium]
MKRKDGTAPMQDDCVFCRIVDGKSPADIVYEDDRVVAFRDANPVAPLHILVVPREHIPTLNDVPEGSDIVSHCGQTAAKIAEMFGVAESGYRVIINVNRGGGQVIFHLHVHVVSKSKPEPGRCPAPEKDK